MKPHHLQWLKIALWISAIFVLTAAAALYYVSQQEDGIPQNPADQAGEVTLSDHGPMPDFQLTDQRGRTVDSSELAGRVLIANFVYTTCPDFCPLLSFHMSRLQTALAEAGVLGSDVVLLSFSVDPEHEPPEVLYDYLENYGADHDHWLFLTTDSKETMRRVIVDGFRVGGFTEVEGGEASGGGSAESGDPGHPDDSAEPRETAGPAAASLFAVGIAEAADFTTEGPKEGLNGYDARRDPDERDGVRLVHEGEDHGDDRVITHSNRFVLVDRESAMRAYVRGRELDVDAVQEAVLELVEEN